MRKKEENEATEPCAPRGGQSQVDRLPLEAWIGGRTLTADKLRMTGAENVMQWKVAGLEGKGAERRGEDGTKATRCEKATAMDVVSAETNAKKTKGEQKWR